MGSKQRSQKITGIMFTAAAALLWSSLGAIIRGIDTPVWVYLSYRSLITIIVLALPAYRAFSQSGRPLPIAVLLASGLSFGLYVGGFVVATRTLGAATAIAMQYAAPIYLFLYTLVRTRRLSLRDDLPKMIMVAGVLVNVLIQVQQVSATALLPAVLCGIGYALFTVTMKRAEGVDPIALIASNNLISGVLFLLLSLPLAASGGFVVTGGDLWVLIISALVVNAFSYVLFARGIRYISALEASCVTLVEPVMNPVWVLLLLGERLDPFDIMFLLLIIGALLLEAVQAAKKTRSSIV